MKNLTRRDALKTGIAAAGLALVLPRLSFAEEPVPPGDGQKQALELSSEIGRNHGHVLALTPAGAVALLRSTFRAAPAVLDIQGSSGHPHSLELGHEELLSLFVSGELVKDSTKVGGHTHPVTVRLLVQEA